MVQAFAYGWEKFRANIGPILTGVVILVVGTALVGIVWGVVVNLLSTAGQDGGGDAVGLAAGVIATLGLFGWLALAFIIQAGIVRVGLAIVDGRPFELSTLLSTHRLGAVILSSLLVGLLTAVGAALLVLPGVIFAWLAQFFLFFVLGADQGPWQAIVSSLRFSVDHFVPVLLLYILSSVALFVGALLCGVGLLVALPIVVIAQAYTFRVLEGQPVAA